MPQTGAPTLDRSLPQRSAVPFTEDVDCVHNVKFPLGAPRVSRSKLSVGQATPLPIMTLIPQNMIERGARIIDPYAFTASLSEANKHKRRQIAIRKAADILRMLLVEIQREQERGANRRADLAAGRKTWRVSA